MSTKNQGNSHNLLYQDYKFPLEDRAFLDDIAYHVYPAPAKRLTDALRETLRILTNWPAVKIQYALHVTDSDASQHAWRAVNEHIAIIGQKDLPFITVEICNGPRPVQEKAIFLPPVKLAQDFDATFNEMVGSFKDWWLDGHEFSGSANTIVASTFQTSTFAYEIRRLLLDLLPSWEGRVYKDAHGKLQMVISQKGDVQFADERVTVRFSIIPPAVFNAAVLEVTEKEKATA